MTFYPGNLFVEWKRIPSKSGLTNDTAQYNFKIVENSDM